MYRAMVSILALGMVLCGCKSMPWERGSNDEVPLELIEEEELLVDAPAPPVEGLPLSALRRFEDIPLPQRLTEDPERTYVYETPALQIGRMVYTSRAAVNELSQFFIDELPGSGWELESVLEAEGAHLIFSKPGKRLEVSIRKQGISRGHVLVLNLTPDSE